MAMTKLDKPPATIEKIGPHEGVVTMQLPAETKKKTNEPDNVLPDADPSNNHWRTPVEWHLTPLYTQLDDADLTNDYDRWNIHAGPYIYAAASREPWYARSLLAGLRIGAVRMQEFSGGAF